MDLGRAELARKLNDTLRLHLPNPLPASLHHPDEKALAVFGAKNCIRRINISQKTGKEYFSGTLSFSSKVLIFENPDSRNAQPSNRKCGRALFLPSIGSPAWVIRAFRSTAGTTVVSQEDWLYYDHGVAEGGSSWRATREICHDYWIGLLSTYCRSGPISAPRAGTKPTSRSYGRGQACGWSGPVRAGQ
jgi:hypothetical protein